MLPIAPWSPVLILLFTPPPLSAADGQNPADSEPLVCRQPTPRVRFRAFGGSSLDLELLFWANNPEEHGRILDAMNTAVYKRFNKTGSEIPYAKQDLYIKAVPDRFSLPKTAPPDNVDGNRSA